MSSEVLSPLIAGDALTPVILKRATIEAVLIHADGTREDLGVIDELLDPGEALAFQQRPDEDVNGFLARVVATLQDIEARAIARKAAITAGA